MYQRTKSYPFLGQPNLHGETPKRTKRRFSLDVHSEDTDEDMEYVPDAKKSKRSPSPPLPIRTMRTRIHQNYQKSTDSLSSDDGDALEEKMSISSSPDLQDQYSSMSHDEEGDVYQRVNYDDPPQTDIEAPSRIQDEELVVRFGQVPYGFHNDDGTERLIGDNDTIAVPRQKFSSHQNLPTISPHSTDVEGSEKSLRNSGSLFDYDATTDDEEPYDVADGLDDPYEYCDSDGVPDDLSENSYSGATDTPEASNSEENQSLPSSASPPPSTPQPLNFEALHQLFDLIPAEDDRRTEGLPERNELNDVDAHWLAFYKGLYQFFPRDLSQRAMTQLLNLAGTLKTAISPNSGVDASSFYRFRQLCSKDNEPIFHYYEDKKAKGKIKYRDLKDSIMQISTTLPVWYERSSSADIPIGHPMKASRWKSLEDKFEQKNLLGLYLFIDGFQPLRYSKVTNYESLSIGLVNTSYEEGSKMISKCCLMVLPKGCDPHLAISKCFIEPLLAIRSEDAYFPKLSKNPLFPVLFSVLGDDVGQRRISGIGGATNPNAINRWLAKTERSQFDLPSLSSQLGRIREEREEDNERHSMDVGTSMDLDNDSFSSAPVLRPSSIHGPLFQRRGERTRHLTMAAFEGLAQQAPKPKRKSQSATPVSPASAGSSVASSVAPTPNISAPCTPQEREDIANGKKKGFQESPPPVRPSTRALRDNEALIDTFRKLQDIITRRDKKDADLVSLQQEFSRDLVPLLRKNGLLLFGSSLAEATVPQWHGLPEVEIDYCGSFSPCLLHNIDLGIIPVTISIVGGKLGSKYRAFINDFLQVDFLAENFSLDPQYQVQLFRTSSSLTSQKATWYRSFFMKYFWNISSKWARDKNAPPAKVSSLIKLTEIIDAVKFIVNSLYSTNKNIDMHRLDDKILEFRTFFHESYKSTYVPNMETRTLSHFSYPRSPSSCDLY